MLARQLSGSTFSVSLVRQGGRYEYVRAAPEAPVPPRPLTPGPGPGANRRVTLIGQNLPLRTAIRLAFTNSGLQYTLDPDLPNVAVTLSARNAKLPDVLDQIVQAGRKAAPDLRWGMAGDIYAIQRQKP
jgi:hypothetical protein